MDIHKHISARHNLFDLKLKEVWGYKDLIWLFTKRSFIVSYKQTILGPLWLLINPLLSSVMHMIVFGNIAKLSTDGAPQLLFYFSNQAIWNFFSSSLSNNSSTFTSHAGLFGKVYFPRLTVPVASMLSCVIRFCIQFALIIVLMLYYMLTGLVQPNFASWLLIPVILLQFGLLGMGLGILASSMTTKYRDLSVLVSFGISLLMYATPVVYPLSSISEGTIRTLVLLNPVTPGIELFRYAVLGTGTVLPGRFLLSWVFTLAVVVFGIMVFNKVERSFMDTV